MWLEVHYHVTPPRLACPTGREVFVHGLIAYVSLRCTAGGENFRFLPDKPTVGLVAIGDRRDVGWALLPVNGLPIGLKSPTYD